MASSVANSSAARQQPFPPPPNPSNSLETSRSNGSSQAASQQQGGPRRTSFNFLRRQKSAESRPPNTRVPSGGKMSKKQRAAAQEELARQQREAAALGRSPPRLPNHAPLPTINAFGGRQGGQEFRPDSVAIATNRSGPYNHNQQGGYPPQQTQGGPEYHAMSSHVPIPAGPYGGSSPGSRNGEFDPYPRSESMTHRGRYSYASSAVSMGTVNSPRRVRRRRDPTPFKYVTVSCTLQREDDDCTRFVS